MMSFFVKTGFIFLFQKKFFIPPAAAAYTNAS